MVRLHYEHDGESHVIELSTGSHIVGRNRTCDFVIRNPSISGQHVRLDVREGEIYFRDLLSRNGTSVNGTKMESGVARPGDVLKIGSVELRCESDARATAASVAPPPPRPNTVQMDPGADELSPEDTPVDQNFVPAVVEPAPLPAAVQVVRPAESALPVPAGRAAAAADVLKKKKILYAAAGFVAVVLLGMLFLPGQPNGTTKPPEKFSFWGTIKSGMDAFRQGNPAQAVQHWQKAEDGRIRVIAKSDNPTARELAQIAAPFAAAGQTLPAVNWGANIQRLRDLVDGGSLSDGEVKAFVIGQLMDACAREQSAQITRQSADQLASAGQYPEALQRYAEIPVASLYRRGVDEAIESLRQKIVAENRRQALAAAARRDWEEALKWLEKIPPNQWNAEDRANQLKWNENIKVRELMRDLNRMARSDDPQQWRRARDELLPRILRDHKGHPDTSTLDDITQALDKKLFIWNVQNLYNQGNMAALEQAAKEPLGAAPEVQGWEKGVKGIPAEGRSQP